LGRGYEVGGKALGIGEEWVERDCNTIKFREVP